MTTRTRKNRKIQIPADVRKNFEDARNRYMVALAYHETIAAERDALDQKLDPSGELRAVWIETDTTPAEIIKIRDESFNAMANRRIAMMNLVDRTEEMTMYLARIWKMGENELPQLFAHMRQRSYSEASRKALDAILRLELS